MSAATEVMSALEVTRRLRKPRIKNERKCGPIDDAVLVCTLYALLITICELVLGICTVNSGLHFLTFPQVKREISTG